MNPRRKCSPPPAGQRRWRAVASCALAAAVAGCGGVAPNGVPPDGMAATIADIRMWHAPLRSQVVFAMDRRATFTTFELAAPDRVVIDIANTGLASTLPTADSGQFIEAIRHGKQPGNTARLVFDLRQPAQYSIKMLPPNAVYGHRLVVDFHHRDAPPAPPTRAIKPAEVFIVIDPGHGGEDVGASGQRSVEKDVALQISLKLKAAIDQHPRLHAELTRSGDYYIHLRQRAAIARRRLADLFISVHANGFDSPRPRGASVYALSLSGGSNEAARRLADKENAADLVGGVSLVDKDHVLAQVLLDLAVNKTIHESISFGHQVLTELGKIGALNRPQVQQAGFAVLKSLSIPSVLIETAFITNPEDEKKLMSAAYQERVAAAIIAGIEGYIANNAGRYAEP